MVTGRDRSIDALRAFAVVAGLALHSAIPYMAGHVPGLIWSIQDGARSVACDFVFWWGRCAQVETFFFIAGFAAIRMRRTQSRRAFLEARVRRLGVPLLAAVMFVLPLVAAIWAIGWTASGRATWAEISAWSFADAEIQTNRLGPVHLWFLEDLLIITGVFGCVRMPDGARHGGWTPRVRALAPMLPVVGAVILAAHPAILFEQRNSFVPDPLRIAYMATFFASGVWFDTMFAGASARRFRGPAAALLLGGAALSAAAVTALSFNAPFHGIDRLAIAVAASAAGWLSIAGALAVASQPAVANSTIVARIAAAAYPIYVLHVPIVAGAQLVLASMPWNAAAKASMACAFVIVASWIIAVAAEPARIATTRVRIAVAGMRPVVWTTAAIALGVVLRLVHYLRNPDVWHDEAALLVNVVERGYSRLLDPLTFHEAAPPLFLFAERWIAVHFGDAELTLRLLPLVASCAALVVFLPLARTVRAALVPVAVLLVASSNQLIGHSVEAKPRSTSWSRPLSAPRSWRRARGRPRGGRSCSRQRRRWLWGELSGRLRRRRNRLRPASGRAARTACRGMGRSGTTGDRHRGERRVAPGDSYPSAALVGDLCRLARRVSHPAHTGSALVWLARSAVGIADYCYRPIGGVLLVPIAIGARVLVRRGDRALAAMLLAPIAFAALAGATRQYPFTGARVMMFALPALSVLAAEGLGALLESLGERMPLATATIVGIAVLPPLALAGRDVMRPWLRPETAAATAYVLAARRPGDLVASGAWEYRYYLRGLGTAFVRLDEQPWPRPTHRLWYVVNGATSDRMHAADQATAGGGYRVVGTKAWRDVSVVELSPP